MHHKITSPSAPCMCTTLRKASRAVTRLYEQAMNGTGLTIMQFSLLRHLSSHGAIPLSRLAECLVMDRTTLYRTLAPLDRQGWVRITDGDGRAKIAALSPAGRQAMLDATGAWECAQANMLDLVGRTNWDELALALQPIIAASQGDAA